MTRFFPDELKANPNGIKSKREIVSTYDYVKNGRLIFQVARFEPKSFAQRHRNDRGEWELGLAGIETCLFHHDEVVDADDIVCLFEGEKDANRGRELGLAATTAPMGAGKWRPQYTATLAGKEVALFPHNDEPGRRHMEHVAGELTAAGCTVRIVNLPGVGHKGGDFSDWCDLERTGDDLAGILIRATPAWTPSEQEPAEPAAPAGC